jgi:hypothetical protein
MFRFTLASVLAAVVLVPLAVSQAGEAAVPAASPPTHTLQVTGSGVSMYPTFTPSDQRYAVTTTEGTGGAVTVHATTSDPAGKVWVNGHLAVGAETQVEALSGGDEISVIIADSAGTAVHSVVYLPAGFPALQAIAHEPGIAPGYVGLTLSQWNQATPNFETAIDSNAVPAHVRSSTEGVLDFKRQPNAHYSVARATVTGGSRIVEMDGAFNEIGSHQTVGLVNTDGHDSVLLANGNRILIAYEPNDVTGKTDAVIQEVDGQGQVVFEWNSRDLAPETVVGGADYAHINSVVVMADGDLLASFRHLSAVLKIATSAHSGFQPGDVVWRLGGRHSDFTFPAGDGGPCAQHTASELDNGHILVFDNGSGWPGSPLCIDPDDPLGPPIARPQTRVTEYALDAVAGTATPVWEWDVPGRFGLFAGSAQRLPNGNTLVGWAAVRGATATEVSPTGETVWEIKDPAGDVESAPFYSTYRALKFDVPDVVRPQIAVRTPAAEATYAFGQRVVIDIGCTDVGGSSLVSCGGAARSGERLDTSTPGRHTFTATAVDGDNNTRTVTRTYTVRAPVRRPDAQLRALPSGAWVGDDVYGGYTDQSLHRSLTRAGQSLAVRVRVQNDGQVAERFTLWGTTATARFRIAYFMDGRDVTRRVTDGTFTTPQLGVGQQFSIRMRVTRTHLAKPGDTLTAKVRAASAVQPTKVDTVAAIVRASR